MHNMRWFTAAVALFAVAPFCQGIDSRSAKVPAIQKANAAAKKERETALKEAHLAVEQKASIDADQKLLTQDSKHLAPASKRGKVLDANPETEPQRKEDPRRGRGNRSRKYNNNRNRKYRRHHGGRYRAYKRKFHNQRDYYYLKKIIDNGMVHDVATLDDIITLDAAEDDLPKKRKKRNTKNQNDDDSCSDDDD